MGARAPVRTPPVGRAAEALGETWEADSAHRRALELEREGAEETDAAERLTRLEDR